MEGKVLIIDDEEKLRGLLKRIVTLEGYTVIDAANLKAAIRLLDREQADVILCDVKLPDGNGIDFLHDIKSKYPLVEIILLTAYGNIPDAIQAMKNGAFDYITKGDDNTRLIPLLSRAMEKVRMQMRIHDLESQVNKKYSFNSILGSSAPIQEAIALAKKVAPADTTVLLLGETGTGKEVFAQAIHNSSRRAAKPFIAVNCSALSKELLESELFGHKAGAFTGAIKDKKGLLEEAGSGTIFLDEIGEMPVEMQAKLLRVLETGEFIKVGDTKTIKVDIRIIAATNRQLQKEIETGHFRSDLFYRLSVFQVTLPALRERQKDIPVLANYFVSLFAAKANRTSLTAAKEYIEALQQYQWPGNIRELKNIVERSVIVSNGAVLSLQNLPVEIQMAETGSSFSAYDLAGVEKAHIQKVLLYTRGNKTEAARLMNIGLTTLYRKIEEYNIA